MATVDIDGVQDNNRVCSEVVLQSLSRRMNGKILVAILASSGLGACDDGADSDADASAQTRDDARVSSGNDGSIASWPDAAVVDARAPTLDGARSDGATTTPIAPDGSDPSGRDAASLDAMSARDGTTPPDAPRVDAGGTRKPLFVAVGYSGLRVVSRDLGLTWQDMTTSGGGGDDEHLLRSVTVGEGLIVATGWKIWTSRDGKAWAERMNASGQWLGGVRYGNNLFVAAGGYGQAAFSSDGITWQKADSRAGNEPARSVAFGGGLFMAATDQKNWWQTSDGKSWAKQPGSHGSADVMWCGDKFSEPAKCTLPEARSNGHTAFGEGVYVSVGSNKLERSTDGKAWTQVFTGSVENVAFGYID
jgi:hypothetical protein